MLSLKGKGVCGGVTLGTLAVLHRNAAAVKRRKVQNAEAEVARFQTARQEAIDKLAELYEKAVADVGKDNAAIFEIHQMMLEDEDYLEAIQNMIRTEQVGNMASKSSANPKVRAHLLKLQRTLAEKNDVVMDGRDIGSTILPNAEVKIYLTASADTRAKRRALEYEQKGEAFDLDQIRKDIIERDERDMNREISPLKQADDAVLVDSSEMVIDQVDDAILDDMMTGIDGFQVCKELRNSNGGIGIIMLSAKTQELDKVTGLMLGADDYVTKPFSPSELLARVDSLYRRVALAQSHSENNFKEELKSGEFTLNLRNRALMKSGKMIELTQIEFQNLLFFFLFLVVVLV